MPKRVPSTSSITSGSSADQAETPAAVAAWSTIPAAVAPAPAATVAIAIRRRRAAKAAWASAAARTAGRHTASRKRTPPTASAIAPYETAFATPKAASVTGPASSSPSSSVDRPGRRPALADREHEAAAHGVRVGRDHPVGGRVRAVPQPGLEADGQRAIVAGRPARLPGVDPLAASVEHAHGAERGFHRLAEPEHDPLRGPFERGTPGRLRLDQDGVRARGLRQRESREHGGDRRERCGSPHQASRAGPPFRRRLRLTTITRTAPSPTAAASDRPAASGKPSSRTPSHVSVPANRRRLAAHRGREPPVEHLHATRLVLAYGRWRGRRHPVDAVVVPLVAAVCGHLLPLRLRRGVGGRGHLHVREAVLVQVRGGRAPVELHGAVGQEAEVRLVPVARDDHRAAGVVAQLDAVVVVQDLRLQTLDGRLDRADL